MADVAAFPTTAKQILVRGEQHCRPFLAGGTIIAGQVVCYPATGVTDTVIASVAGAGTLPVGVAITGGASGDYVTVAMDGAEAYCLIADQSTGVDAGNEVETNDNAIGGTVSEFAPRADLASTVIDGSNDTTIDGSSQIVGVAMEDGTAATAGGWVLVRIRCRLALWSDHAVV